MVGGLAVSTWGEVRFTRDVGIAIAVSDDAETEQLVNDLGSSGHAVIATFAHTAQRRLATVRLRSPSAVVVGLIAASSGIEREVVDRADAVTIEGVEQPERLGGGAAMSCRPHVAVAHDLGELHHHVRAPLLSRLERDRGSFAERARVAPGGVSDD